MVVESEATTPPTPNTKFLEDSMSRSVNHVEAAAADFARHTKGGEGWALGLAVAACVDPSGLRSKVTAAEFAAKANTTADRVNRYLKAWAAAAAKQIVAPAADLTPHDWDDADHLPTGYEWTEFYDSTASSGGTVHGTQRETLLAAAEAAGVGPGMLLNVASNPALVAVALEASPEFREKVASKLTSSRATSEISGKVIERLDPPAFRGDRAPAVAGSSVIDEITEAHGMIAKVRTLHHDFARHIREHPQVWKDPVLVEQFGHFLGLLNGDLAVVTGVTDADLDSLLAGGS